MGHRPTYRIDFGEFRINSFLEGYKINPYILKPMESNYKTVASI